MRRHFDTCSFIPCYSCRIQWSTLDFQFILISKFVFLQWTSFGRALQTPCAKHTLSPASFATLWFDTFYFGGETIAQAHFEQHNPKGLIRPFFPKIAQASKTLKMHAQGCKLQTYYCFRWPDGSGSMQCNELESRVLGGPMGTVVRAQARGGGHCKITDPPLP